jgi:hypothetical protein
MWPSYSFPSPLDVGPRPFGFELTDFAIAMAADVGIRRASTAILHVFLEGQEGRNDMHDCDWRNLVPAVDRKKITHDLMGASFFRPFFPRMLLVVPFCH